MATKGLRKEFGMAISAAESAIRVNTDEIGDALKTILDLCKEYGWEMRVWDHVAGTMLLHGDAPSSAPEAPQGQPGLAQALSGSFGPGVHSMLTDVLRFHQEIPKPDMSTKGEVQPIIMVVLNFHLGFEGQDRGPLVSVVQHIIRDTCSTHPQYKKFEAEFKSREIKPDHNTGKFIVGLMPATDEEGIPVRLPPEVSPLFAIIDHELPDIAEMRKILDGTIKKTSDDDEQDILGDESRGKVCRFALGLTRGQAEGIFARAWVRWRKRKNFRDMLPAYVWKAKTDILNKEGLVIPYEGKETFADIVGLDGMKRLLPKLLKADKLDPDNPEVRSRGICAVGPPRTGKSLIIKALGNEVGLPVYRVDPGRLMGGHVGDTERMTRKFFQLLKVLAPCIGWIDEVEKVMPSGRASDSTSGGVDTRMAGTFMTQMQDMEEAIFWAFTANSVKELHEAFLDDDRIDLKFYVRMPSPKQLAAGWKLFVKKFFPVEVNEVTNPGFLETEFEIVLAELKKAKKVQPSAWADRFVPTLMCMEEEKRKKALSALANVDSNVSQTASGLLIVDDGWTIARIKTVCRLSRKMDLSLTEASMMVPGKQKGRQRVVRECDKWAEEEQPIDAETGKAFTSEDIEASRAHREISKVSVRRKPRKQYVDEDDD